MIDPVLEKALLRREELLKKLNEIESFLKTYHSFKAESQGKPKGWAGRGSQTKDILDAVTDVLLRESPLKPSEIVSRLKQKGFRVPGSDPASNLSAKLSSAKNRFKTLGHGLGWILVEQEKTHEQIK